MTMVTRPSGRAPQPVPDLDELLADRRAADLRIDGSGAVAATDDPGVTPGRAREAARTIAVLAVVLGASVVLGSLLGVHGRTLVHNKMLPWILGRSLGVASYLALAALVVLGLWLRHPWRARFRRPAASSILWAHVTLAAATVTLLAGHLTALAADTYAGVGWTGVFVPWGAQYRPTPTALGTLALYALLLVAGTAALAGSIGRRIWFPIHTVSVLVFCLTLAHGILAGSDAYSLRWVYVATGGVVLVLQATRWIGGRAGHGAAAVLE